MYRDGICRVSGNYYTKTVQFFDINYQLAQADDKPRNTAGMAEKFLCQPQRRQDICPLRLQVERINPAEGHRPPRIVVERQQRGERTPAHGVDIDIGIGKRADAQHISHRLPHDESFNIPQAHPVFTR